MLELISLLCIVAALILLIALSIIDLKILILPDELNFLLGLSGVIFYLTASQQFFAWSDMLWGAAIGAGMLYVIRFVANRYYGRDTLGLGDVKLMGAAGLWLGVEGILPAITIGAMAGLVQGLIYAGWLAWRHRTSFSIHDLTIPAGPGFAVGIVLSGAYLYSSYIVETFYALISG